MIDTEVESAMRSNSGEKKKRKKLSKGRRGRGDEERRQRRKKKKTHCELRTTFFLKEEKFRLRSLGYPSLQAPLSGAVRRAGGGGEPPPFVSLRARLCDITHSTLFGVLVVVLLFFCRAGRRARLSLFASWSRSPSLAPGLRFPS